MRNYGGALSELFVTSMNRFACDLGILGRQVPYEKVVTTQFRLLLNALGLLLREAFRR
jgi:hypothetical protein